MKREINSRKSKKVMTDYPDENDFVSKLDYKSKQALWLPSINKWNHPHIMKVYHIFFKTNRNLPTMSNNVSRLMMQNS